VGKPAYHLIGTHEKNRLALDAPARHLARCLEHKVTICAVWEVSVA
jgi:hypothetical protein